MTYEQFALLAANKGLRTAWDAMKSESVAKGCCARDLGEWECDDCGEIVTGDFCPACVKLPVATLPDVVIQGYGNG